MATSSTSSTPPPENTLPPTTSLAPVTTTLAPPAVPDDTFNSNADDTPVFVVPLSPDRTFSADVLPPVFVVPLSPDKTFSADVLPPVNVTLDQGSGGLPLSVDTVEISKPLAPPPENTRPSVDTPFIGTVTRADPGSVALVRPRTPFMGISLDVDAGDGSITTDVDAGDGITSDDLILDPGVNIEITNPSATFLTGVDDSAVDIIPALLPDAITCSTGTVSIPDPNIPFIGPVTRADSVAVVRPRDLVATDPDATSDTNSDNPNVIVTPALPPGSEPVVDVPPEAIDDTIVDDTTKSSSPDLIARFIGRKVSIFDNIMYRGAVQGNDGKLYIVPYASNDLVVTDLSSEKQDFYDITSFARTGSLAKFIGGAIAPNGKIYLGPQQASTPLIVDTSQDLPSISQVSGGTPEIAAQARGPAYFNNRVYIPTYKSGFTGRWIVVNTDTDKLENSITRPTHPRTDDIFLTRVNYATENLNNATKHYDSLEGGVAGNNGKIYGMPYGASRISIVDTDTQTSTWGEDYITGNAPIDDVAFSTVTGMLMTKTYFNKYKYGALAGNGCIYAHGHRARSILKIDTSDDSATEIPYPKVIIDAMLNGGSAESADTAKAASFGSVLGSDGKVYSTPWNIPFLIWIDTKDDTIGYLDISDILDSSGSSSNNGWYTLATAVGNNLYFSPGTSEKILVIELPGTDSVEDIINPLGLPSATFDTNADDPPVNIIFDIGIDTVEDPGPSVGDAVDDRGDIINDDPNTDEDGNAIDPFANNDLDEEAGDGSTSTDDLIDPRDGSTSTDTDTGDGGTSDDIIFDTDVEIDINDPVTIDIIVTDSGDIITVDEPKKTGPPITGPPITGPPITGPPITGPPITGPPITQTTGPPLSTTPPPPNTLPPPPITGPPITQTTGPPLSTTPPPPNTLPPPPPPPPPPGLPLDECLLECLTFTTPLPPPPGIPRAVPVRLNILFERTTIPPVLPLNPGTPAPEVPTPPTPLPPTGITSTTSTTTLNPCPPECDIPSF